MINKALFPKAYTEVLEILKFVHKSDFEKIPRYIIENMEAEKDSSYKYEVSYINDFEKQEMLKETEAILAVIYRDYWTTEEQKKKIQEIETIERKMAEEEKIQKYFSTGHD